MIIVFLGPDGCGKTTIAERVHQDLLTLHGRVAEMRAYNFGVLPPLSRLLRLKRGGSGGHRSDINLSGMVKPVPFVRLLPSFAWNVADYFLGSIISLGTRKDYIFARYYYDNYYQRSYRAFPRWLLAIGEVFVRKPDAIFILERNPQSIHAQKPELTEKEISHQYDLLQQKYRNSNIAYSIDANSGVEQTLEAVMRIVERVME